MYRWPTGSSALPADTANAFGEINIDTIEQMAEQKNNINADIDNVFGEKIYIKHTNIDRIKDANIDRIKGTN